MSFLARTRSSIMPAIYNMRIYYLYQETINNTTAFIKECKYLILNLGSEESTNIRMYSGEPGSGAGKGGGGGGSIREAGGSFGKMEAAREDEYFYKQQKQQLENIKGHLDKEIKFHQEQIKRHEDAIRRHKEQMTAIPNK